LLNKQRTIYTQGYEICILIAIQNITKYFILHLPEEKNYRPTGLEQHAGE